MAIEQPVTLRIDGLTGAFAPAGRPARSEGELFERCRRVVAERLNSDHTWFSITATGRAVQRFGPSTPIPNQVEVSRHTTGSVEVVIDAALYTAKRNGGAMVVTAGED
ncbi:MAG: hypothetical protein EXR94_02740 [Gemmatimonadetes bacterium]|nr:hypothetical protein [Gemmatimonadota bacterium]